MIQSVMWLMINLRLSLCTPPPQAPLLQPTADSLPCSVQTAPSVPVTPRWIVGLWWCNPQPRTLFPHPHPPLAHFPPCCAQHPARPCPETTKETENKLGFSSVLLQLLFPSGFMGRVFFLPPNPLASSVRICIKTLYMSSSRGLIKFRGETWCWRISLVCH